MQIRWVHVDELADERRRYVEDRLRALAAEHDDVIDVRIGGRDSAHHRHGARQICIDCCVRGREIVAVRDGVSLAVAIDAALDAFERELRKHRARLRDRGVDHGPPPEPRLGTIDEILAAQSSGVIRTDDGETVYFHRESLRGLEFETLRAGDRVALRVESGEKGPQASSVVPPPLRSPRP